MGHSPLRVVAAGLGEAAAGGLGGQRPSAR